MGSRLHHVADEVDAELDLQLVQREHLPDTLGLRDLLLLDLSEEASDEVLLVGAVERDLAGKVRPLDRSCGPQTGVTAQVGTKYSRTPCSTLLTAYSGTYASAANPPCSPSS